MRHVATDAWSSEPTALPDFAEDPFGFAIAASVGQTYPEALVAASVFRRARRAGSKLPFGGKRPVFKEWEHPRGRDGRFIEKFGDVDIFKGKGSTRPQRRGVVSGFEPDGVWVKVTASSDPREIGQRMRFRADQIEQARKAKARIRPKLDRSEGLAKPDDVRKKGRLSPPEKADKDIGPVRRSGMRALADFDGNAIRQGYRVDLQSLDEETGEIVTEPAPVLYVDDKLDLLHVMGPDGRREFVDPKNIRLSKADPNPPELKSNEYGEFVDEKGNPLDPEMVFFNGGSLPGESAQEFGSRAARLKSELFDVLPNPDSPPHVKDRHDQLGAELDAMQQALASGDAARAWRYAQAARKSADRLSEDYRVSGKSDQAGLGQRVDLQRQETFGRLQALGEMAERISADAAFGDGKPRPTIARIDGPGISGADVPEPGERGGFDAVPDDVLDRVNPNPLNIGPELLSIDRELGESEDFAQARGTVQEAIANLEAVTDPASPEVTNAAGLMRRAAEELEAAGGPDASEQAQIAAAVNAPRLRQLAGRLGAPDMTNDDRDLALERNRAGRERVQAAFGDDDGKGNWSGGELSEEEELELLREMSRDLPEGEDSSSSTPPTCGCRSGRLPGRRPRSA